MAGNSTAEVVGNGYPVRIDCKDIYRMKILEVLEKILNFASAEFGGREDVRHLYSFYASAYKKPDKNGVMHSIEEIRREMEATGLEFDPMLFEGGER